MTSRRSLPAALSLGFAAPGMILAALAILPPLLADGVASSVPASPSPVAVAPPVSPFAAFPSHFALLDGKRVHFRVAGAGPVTLVLIHGWTCDLDFWREQLPLASRFRLLLVDLPGHGRSELPASWSMDLFARAVDAAMSEAGVPRAILVGHSMGTPVARQFLRLFPARTAGIVALDGSLRSFFTDPEKVKAFLASLEGAEGLVHFRQALEGMLQPVADPSLKEFIRSRMGAAPQAVIAGAARAMFDLSIWKDDPIGVPLLSILAKGPAWDEGYRNYVRKLNPAAAFVELEGVSHFLMLEKPGPVNDAIEAFATKVIPPSASRAR